MSATIRADRFNRMQAAGREATGAWVKANFEALRRNGINIDAGLYNMLHTMFVEGWHARAKDIEAMAAIQPRCTECGYTMPFVSSDGSPICDNPKCPAVIRDEAALMEGLTTDPN